MRLRSYRPQRRVKPLPENCYIDVRMYDESEFLNKEVIKFINYKVSDMKRQFENIAEAH